MLWATARQDVTPNTTNKNNQRKASIYAMGALLYTSALTACINSTASFLKTKVMREPGVEIRSLSCYWAVYKAENRFDQSFLKI